MSIRIIPAPARVQSYFDDGIVPLSAKVIDHEDYQAQPWQIAPIAAYQYYQDEPFKLVIATLEDDSAFAWAVPPAMLGAYFAVVEDDALPNAKAFALDDMGVSLPVFISDQPIFRLMTIDEDTLPVSGFTPLFRKTLSSIGGRIGQRQLQG